MAPHAVQRVGSRFHSNFAASWAVLIDQAGYKLSADMTGFGARGPRRGVMVDDERSTRNTNTVKTNIANSINVSQLIVSRSNL
jgi:hypothetical protein